MLTKTCSITLNNLELHVLLGWPHDERLQTQTVVLDVFLGLQTPPAACLSDNLTDTYCYDSLVKHIQTCCADKTFQLVEHLGFTLYQAIREKIAPQDSLRLRLTKMPTAYLPDLKGGVTFEYGDAVPQPSLVSVV